MDSAVYVPAATPFIAGVHNGTLYKLDPNTGAKLTSVVFDQRIWAGLSAVEYDPVTLTILAAGTMNSDLVEVPLKSPRFIVRIDPTTLAVGPLYDLRSILAAYGNDGGGIRAGALQLVASGGVIYAAISTTVSGTIDSGFVAQLNAGAMTLIQSSNQGVLVCPRSHGMAIKGTIAYTIDARSQVLYAQDMSTNTFYSQNNIFNLVPTWWPVSIGYSPDSDQLYVPSLNDSVQNDGSIIRVFTSVDDGFGNLALQSTINTGRAAFNGLSVRQNPFNHLVYVAGGGDNSVCVINPTGAPIMGIAPTNGFVIKTGFDFPVDITFTPTKAWAVQQGAQGLKEVVLP